MCQGSLCKISIFRPRWQPCLSFRGDFPGQVSSFTFSGCLVMMPSVGQWSWYIVPPGCWGVRAQTKGQEQARWLDLQLLPFGAALVSAWCGFPRGSREEQSGKSRESTPGVAVLSLWELTTGCHRASSPWPCLGTHGHHPVGRLWTLHFLQPLGLCLPSSAADFLPIKEKTEDSEQNTSFYFFFPSFIPQTYS